MDDKNIFSIYDLAIGTINNIYTYYGEQNHRARYFCYYGMNTDIEWLNGSDGGDDKANMVNYNTLPNNGQLNTADAKEPWSRKQIWPSKAYRHTPTWKTTKVCASCMARH